MIGVLDARMQESQALLTLQTEAGKAIYKMRKRSPSRCLRRSKSNADSGAF